MGLAQLISKAKALGRSVLAPDGSEVLDPTPVELPIGFERPESIQEMIRRFVTDPQLRQELEGRGVETFDEADDFDIPDDVPVSPHEDNFDPMHLLAREQEIRSGAVMSRTPEEVEVARKFVADYEASLKPKSDSKPAA